MYRILPHNGPDSEEDKGQGHKEHDTVAHDILHFQSGNPQQRDRPEGLNNIRDGFSRGKTDQELVCLQAQIQRRLTQSGPATMKMPPEDGMKKLMIAIQR